MILGKLAGAGAGWFVHPVYGTMIGAMIGHFLDRAWKKWRRSKAETSQRRRQRSKTIRQSGARKRGESLRSSAPPGSHDAGNVPLHVSPGVRKACELLGVSPADSRDAVKERWRKLVSEHHPDKLHSRGSSAAEIQAASQQLASIQKAWEQLREARGWR